MKERERKKRKIEIIYKYVEFKIEVNIIKIGRIKIFEREKSCAVVSD